MSFRTYISVISIILTTSLFAQGSSLKVFWWNVAGFNKNKPTILQTLEDTAYNYDVILLGESRPAIVEEFRKTSVGKEFIFSDHSPYPLDASIELSILSKYPIKRIKDEILDWGNTEQKNVWLKKYKQEPYNGVRRLSVFEVSQQNQKYLVAPIHFMNPWHIMQAVDGYLATGFNIYFGESNPLFYQTQQALLRLQNAGYLTNKLPFILIGDFNSPSNPKIGSSLSLINKYMTNLMLDNRPTFISKGLKIDHAFGNANVESLHDEVLFFEGSDHYPIELEVQAIESI